MFKNLRNKLKNVLSKFSKDVEEESEVVKEVKEDVVGKTPEKEIIAEQPVTEKEEAVEDIPKEIIAEQPVTEKEPAQEEETEDSTTEEKEETPEEVIEEIKEAEIEEKIVEELVQEKESVIEEVEEEPVQEEVEEEPTEEVKEIATDEEPTEEPEKKKGFFGRMFGKKEEIVEEPTEKVKESTEEEPAQEAVKEEPKKKEGFFTKLTKITLSEQKFEELFWDLEVTLLENNVAVEVIEKIKEDLKQALTGEKVSKKSVDNLIMDTLRSTIKEILSVEPIDLLKKAEEHKPLIITMIGVNGSGKTTTLAKLINYFQKHDKSVVVAAADTFRAAAIQQLEEHTTKLDVKLIKHDYNADPAAVAFDAVKHAKAKGIDIVLIDSAGRLHSNDNLMNELKKLIRVNEPDMNIFVGEAITGNDCVEQAKLFDEAVGIDGIILAKADVDEKGGAAISASFVTKKPILFLGTGQTYDDLEPFNVEKVLESLGL